MLPYLQDQGVMELRVTSTGAAFVVTFGQGKQRVENVPASTLDSFLCIIASMVGTEWRALHPRLHAAIPALGWRIQASMPPISPGIEMVLRRHPSQVFPLDDFVAKGILTPRQREILEGAVRDRKTIIVSGAVGSSKTSLTNALLHTLRDSHERIVVLEDTPELMLDAEEVTFQRTCDATMERPAITLRDLCRDVLRLSPDRLVIGEVRGAEALDMLKAFQCGTPGMCTVHSESARGTLERLGHLVEEVSASPQKHLIGEAVDLIANMTQHGRSWRCRTLLAVKGYDGHTYLTEELT